MIKAQRPALRFTSPNKILFSAKKISKTDLADYYTSVQKWILPYIVKRPLTLVRCPQGADQHCFYQKHLSENPFEKIFPVRIKDKNGISDYLYIKDLNGLLSLVQLNVLEIHPWGCRIDQIEKPDSIIFDLDPAPEIAYKVLIDAAFFIQQQLADTALQSFVKTTGGKGLHIIVPIKRLYSWEDIKIFSENFVNFIVSERPNEFIGTMSKAKRQGKIFIDHLRNRRGATAVAPYSTRAKPTATVSTPLTWDELKYLKKIDFYHIHNVLKRIAELKDDPWSNFLNLHQTIPIK